MALFNFTLNQNESRTITFTETVNGTGKDFAGYTANLTIWKPDGGVEYQADSTDDDPQLSVHSSYLEWDFDGDITPGGKTYLLKAVSGGQAEWITNGVVEVKGENGG